MLPKSMTSYNGAHVTRDPKKDFAHNHILALCAQVLLPNDLSRHAWIRDNVYGGLAVWGLALAHRKSVDPANRAKVRGQGERAGGKRDIQCVLSSPACCHGHRANLDVAYLFILF